MRRNAPEAAPGGVGRRDRTAVPGRDGPHDTGIEHALNAAKGLGARLMVDDLALEDTQRRVALLQRVARDLQPQVAFIPAMDDQHPSRREAFRIAKAAFASVPLVLGYQTATTGLDFKPTRLEDVADEMMEKMEALTCYQDSSRRIGWIWRPGWRRPTHAIGGGCSASARWRHSKWCARADAAPGGPRRPPSSFACGLRPVAATLVFLRSSTPGMHVATAPHLEFERDIVEIQGQIEKLLDLAERKGIDVSAEVLVLRGQARTPSRSRRTRTSAPSSRSRSPAIPARPYTLDYVERVFTDWIELHGDRAFRDDEAMVAAGPRLGGAPSWSSASRRAAT